MLTVLLVTGVLVALTFILLARRWYSYLAPWAKTISFEARAEDCCSLVL